MSRSFLRLQGSCSFVIGFAAAGLLSTLSATALSAQSSDPARLREIIDAKNRAAAQETWANSTPLPSVPLPSGSGGAAGGSGSGNGQGSGSGAPGAGSAGGYSGGGFSSGTPDTQVSPAAAQPGSDTATSAGNTSSDATSAAAPDPSTAGKAGNADATSSDSIPAATVADPSVVILSSPAKLAEITLTGGLVKVKAENSSLTQTLHDLCKTSGITMTGVVRDERVFGTFGPGKPAEVIAKLLEGVPVNSVLRVDKPTGSRELTLTPRPAAKASTPSR